MGSLGFRHSLLLCHALVDYFTRRCLCPFWFFLIHQGWVTDLGSAKHGCVLFSSFFERDFISWGTAKCAIDGNGQVTYRLMNLDSVPDQIAPLWAVHACVFSFGPLTHFCGLRSFQLISISMWRELLNYIKFPLVSLHLNSAQRAVSVWTAVRPPPLSGGEMEQATTSATPAASITRWTVRTGPWSSPNADWWVAHSQHSLTQTHLHMRAK